MSNNQLSIRDPRQGLPSASGMYRLAACSGSWQLEQRCPAEPESDAAAEGTLIHKALSKEIGYDTLNDDQQWCYNQCRDQELILVNQFFGDATIQEIREKRYWYEGADNKPLFSGQPDVVYLKDDKALVIDYKTGRIPVDTAAGNWQLRSLALAVWFNHIEVEEVIAAIIQPRTSAVPTVVKYDFDAINQTAFDMEPLFADVFATNAPFVAGDHCKWCRGKSICPELQNVALATIPVQITVPEHIKATVPQLVGEELATILPKVEVAQMYIDAVKAHAKQLLIEGGTIAGYELKQGSTRREIVDPAGAFQAVSDMISAADFAGCCTVKIGELEEIYTKATGLKKKDAKTALAEVLGDTLTTKQSAPVLVRSAAA